MVRIPLSAQSHRLGFGCATEVLERSATVAQPRQKRGKCQFESDRFQQTTVRDGAVVARKAHNLEVGGSSPSPATIVKKCSEKICAPFMPAAKGGDASVGASGFTARFAGSIIFRQPAVSFKEFGIIMPTSLYLAGVAQRLVSEISNLLMWVRFPSPAHRPGKVVWTRHHRCVLTEVLVFCIFPSVRTEFLGEWRNW